MSSASAKSIGKYEIVGLIAKGTRASVYRGADIDTRRPVAVKVIGVRASNSGALPAFRANRRRLRASSTRRSPRSSTWSTTTRPSGW